MEILRPCVRGFILSIFFFEFTFAQAIGDYRTITSGDWNANSTWETGNGLGGWLPAVATPTSTNGVITIRAGHTIVVTMNVTVDQVVIDVAGEVSIASSITLTIANDTGTDLTVNGTLAMSGSALTFSPSATLSYGATGILLYNGSSQQTTSDSEFPGSGGPPDLTINNDAGVILHAPRTISDTLTLTAGRLVLGANSLTLGASALISGTPSASNMIVADGTGELRKVFTAPASFDFPIGDDDGTAEFSPVALNFISGTFGGGAYAAARATNAKHPNNGSTIDYINRYWTVTSSGISSFSCDASFTYVNADIVGNEANYYCASWNGSAWTLLNSGNPAGNTLSGTVTALSDFSGGETGALPVQMAEFIAEGGVRNAELRWRTETEVENYGFEVERRTVASSELTVASSNQQGTGNRELETSWLSIGFVQGSGTSSSPREYSFLDRNLSAGRYAYRIKQIDERGAFTYTSAVEVEVGLAPRVFTLGQNYPNPFNPTATIEFTLPEDGHVTLKIYDVVGRELATLVDEVRKAGVYQLVVFDASRMASGFYFARLQTGRKQQMKKMMLVK